MAVCRLFRGCPEEIDLRNCLVVSITRSGRFLKWIPVLRKESQADAP